MEKLIEKNREKLLKILISIIILIGVTGCTNHEEEKQLNETIQQEKYFLSIKEFLQKVFRTTDGRPYIANGELSLQSINHCEKVGVEFLCCVGVCVKTDNRAVVAVFCGGNIPYACFNILPAFGSIFRVGC